MQLVRGEQDEGNEHEDGGALLFGRHRAEFLVLGLQGGAQGLPIHLGREDQHDQPHRHEGIQHTGKEVMHGVFHHVLLMPEAFCSRPMPSTRSAPPVR